MKLILNFFQYFMLKISEEIDKNIKNFYRNWVVLKYFWFLMIRSKIEDDLNKVCF